MSNLTRQRLAGQLPLDLADRIGEEIQAVRRHRLGQGAELEQIDLEIARRFGPDLQAFDRDEVGTASLFPS